MYQNAAYPICRHIKTDGHRCQSPAQSVSAFCYHHRNLRRTPKYRRRASEISAISQAIAIIAHQASTGVIQHQQARLMLHALNYAANLHATQAE